ncbi:MAG: cyclase family protein [Crocinitomicaceae bacterium]|nr:cyclase family protein [Crocinitomicaceae bacterium]
MKLYIDKETYVETEKAVDISIPLSNTEDNPRAWYVEKPVIEPVRTEHYIGSVKEGGAVNFRNIAFNPHGHGTHTECLGHITHEVHSVNQVMSEYFFRALVISVLPKRIIQENGDVDFVILPEQLELEGVNVDALVVRTLPNDRKKMKLNYSSTNPTYFHESCVEKILEAGIQHLLVDTPSVDREEDGGVLAFHHSFWGVPNQPNFKRTITELIFVDNSIVDGDYLLELQVAPFVNDAAPSRPLLYRIQKES